MSLEEIFADVKKEGENPFPVDKETETPTESQSVKEQDKEEPAQGEKPKEEEKPEDSTEKDDTPFHIRWKKREETLKEEFNQKFEDYKREIEKTVEEKTRHEDNDIPEWFKELHGDNQLGWAKYQEREKAREAEIEKRVLESYKSEIQAKENENKKWEKWVDEQVALLEGEGKKFDKNELIKTVIDFGPRDEQGNYSLRKGYDIMEALKSKQDDTKKEAAQVRKQIADTTINNKGAEISKKEFLTPNDLRNKSWNQI